MRELTRRILLRLSREARAIAETLAASTSESAHRRAVLSTNSGYDMMTDPDEAHYAQQYRALLDPMLASVPAGRDAAVLDLGAGYGRLALPCARWATRGSVRAVDMNADALHALAKTAGELGLTKLETVRSDIVAYARSLEPSSLDAVVCCEVLYNVQEWRSVLTALAGAVKPGGAALFSFRSRWFEVQRSLAARDFASAQAAVERREGHWGGGGVWSCWQTPTEARRAVESAGLVVEKVSGIGVLSGLAEDPMGRIIRPSLLDEQDRESLNRLESALAEEHAAEGRYIAVVAGRPPRP